MLKKAWLSLWPFLSLVFLLLLLVGNGFVTQYTAGEEEAEIYYRPAIMYNDRYYLTTSGRPFRNLSKDSLACVGVLAEDVSIHELPAENMQSCGCESLVGGKIFTCKEYPDYLFMYDEDDRLHSFVWEDAR